MDLLGLLNRLGGWDGFEIDTVEEDSVLQCHHRFDLGQNQRLRNGHIGGERSRAAAPSGVAPPPTPRVLTT